MPTILDVARFVRDTDCDAHSLPALYAQFGQDLVQTAIQRGLLAQQVWGADRTDFVDLTAIGERELNRVAAENLRTQEWLSPTKARHLTSFYRA